MPPASLWQVASSSEFFARPAAPAQDERLLHVPVLALWGAGFWWLRYPQIHFRRRDTKEWLESCLGGKAAVDFLKEIRHDEMKHRDAFKN